MLSILTRWWGRPTFPDYGFLGVDLHSHLIPAIDDGVPDLDTALDCLRRFAALGYRKVITTPHINQDYYPNTAAIIRQGLESLRAAARDEGLTIAIDAAAEYLLDDDFLTLFRRGEVLTFGDRYLLFELPFAVPPVNLDDLVFEMQTRGYRPVLAHPERYTYLSEHPDRLDSLRERGCLFQLNLLSLAGQYGGKARQQARRLLRADQVDFLGSDLHRPRHAEKLARMLETADLDLLKGKTFLNERL